MEKGVERFDKYVKILVDYVLLGEHTADVGDLGGGSSMREDRCRAWVGWGSENSRGDDGTSLRGECQYEHSEVSATQVLSDRDGVLVDHAVETTNVLIRRIPNDAIDGLAGKIIHDFVERSRGHDGAMLCP